MGLSQNEVSKAIKSRLDNGTTLQAIVSGRVYDLGNVPIQPTRPYVVVGEAVSTPRDTFTNTGSDIVQTLHTWSTHRGKKEVESIQNAIYEALDRKEDQLTLTGHKCNSCRFTSNHIMSDNSSGEKLIHGVDRYRVWTEAA